MKIEPVTTIQSLYVDRELVGKVRKCLRRMNTCPWTEDPWRRLQLYVGSLLNCLRLEENNRIVQLGLVISGPKSVTKALDINTQRIEKPNNTLDNLSDEDILVETCS